MIIQEKSKELLKKLRKTNYRQLPDIGMDTVSEKIIEIISNECKSTLLTTDDTGNLQSRRYESDIIKENLHQIIRQLILNGGTIPKEVMKNIMCSNGMIMGVNSDIQLYKGIQEQEDGSMETTATIGNAVINIRELAPNILQSISQEIYTRYARQFVLENAEQLPRVSKFSIFKEKMLHGRENREFIAKQFEKILREQTGYSDEIITATVQYHLDYMYSNKFKQEILGAMNSGTSLVSLDAKAQKVSFNHLLGAVYTETQDMTTVIPNINQIHKDITQAYADVETQLIAYSTDITRIRLCRDRREHKAIKQKIINKSRLTKTYG